ncbi:MAG: ATP-dependent DNA ligase [Methanomicrobiales archaeon]|nr:ATP-dependent DNA ligase [Methanomicrobiales archaeon]
MHPLLDQLSGEHKEKLIERDQPDWVEPMLATLTDRRFHDRDWIFERKFDGERCLVFRKGDTVRLLSRNRKRLNDTYPELEEALRKVGERRFIADGEIVAFEGEVTSFSRLQERMRIQDREKAERSGVAVSLYLFDLMYLDGYDLCALDLRARKSILARLFAFEDPIRYTEHRDGDGVAFYRDACAKGWEGVIAKRAAGRYLHRRSTDWLKFKCVNQQEFVIGGYTDPSGSRTGFGALLLGYYEGNDLISAGKVGTGFDDRTLQDLGDRLLSRERKTSPFADKDRPEKGEHFVTPDLVCEVAFTEWTDDGKLRHPRFLGMRQDKTAEDVVRERPG